MKTKVLSAAKNDKMRDERDKNKIARENVRRFEMEPGFVARGLSVRGLGDVEKRVGRNLEKGNESLAGSRKEEAIASNGGVGPWK